MSTLCLVPSRQLDFMLSDKLLAIQTNHLGVFLQLLVFASSGDDHRDLTNQGLVVAQTIGRELIFGNHRGTQATVGVLIKEDRLGSPRVNGGLVLVGQPQHHPHQDKDQVADHYDHDGDQSVTEFRVFNFF